MMFDRRLQQAASERGLQQYTAVALLGRRQVGKTTLRGGYPLSYLAGRDDAVYQWLQDFMATFLRRDLPDLGVRVPAETLRRFWTMLAHLHGHLFNASELGRSLGGALHATAGRYLDILVDTLMVRIAAAARMTVADVQI
jgi:predicted AAA+ superfamily ATPase